MRLFVAILPDEPVRRALCRVQDELRRMQVRGGYTPPENLHMTLAFIGEYPDPDAVLEVLAGVPGAPFGLRLEGLGAFGDTWWAGTARSEALECRVRALRRALDQAGIPFDRKRFAPHITLLRRAERGGRPMPGVAVPDAGMTVERLSLMRSDRGKHGMIYTEIS